MDVSRGCFFLQKKTLFNSKSVFDDKKCLSNASYENIPEKYSDWGLISPRTRNSQIECNHLL